MTVVVKDRSQPHKNLTEQKEHRIGRINTSSHFPRQKDEQTDSHSFSCYKCHYKAKTDSSLAIHVKRYHLFQASPTSGYHKQLTDLKWEDIISGEDPDPGRASGLQLAGTQSALHHHIFVESYIFK